MSSICHGCIQIFARTKKKTKMLRLTLFLSCTLNIYFLLFCLLMSFSLVISLCLSASQISLHSSFSHYLYMNSIPLQPSHVMTFLRPDTKSLLTRKLVRFIATEIKNRPIREPSLSTKWIRNEFIRNSYGKRQARRILTPICASESVRGACLMAQKYFWRHINILPNATQTQNNK
jgi:hypothetical protein